MLPQTGNEPMHHVLHATLQLIPIFARSLSPLESYVVMLYGFLDLEFFAINGA